MALPNGPQLPTRVLRYNRFVRASNETGAGIDDCKGQPGGTPFCGSTGSVADGRRLASTGSESGVADPRGDWPFAAFYSRTAAIGAGLSGREFRGATRSQSGRGCAQRGADLPDRKSTRLNSSHLVV